MAIDWKVVEQGRENLIQILDHADLTLTPLEFVVLNEILQEYQERNPSDDRTRVMLAELKFTFYKLGDT